MIVIKMKQPRSCIECPIHRGNGISGRVRCPIKDRDVIYAGDTQEWCPIVGEIPESHGRLVDASELGMQMRKYGFRAVDMTVHEFVEDCLTPILAGTEEQG